LDEHRGSSTVDEVQSKIMTDRRERKKKQLRGRGIEREREGGREGGRVRVDG
jgi:hypothetical protein